MLQGALGPPQTVPPTHSPSVPTLWPQYPQFVPLVSVLTHSPSQTVGKAGGHWHVYGVPARHDAPVAQALPHAPQLLRSVFVSTQASLQLVVYPPDVLQAMHFPPVSVPLGASHR